MSTEEPTAGVDEQLNFEALVLPSQFTDLLRGQASRPPELNLVEAILEDAVRTLLGCSNRSGRRNQRLFRESEEWFLADETDWPFSFLNVCAVLGLDPDYIRLGLRRTLAEAPDERLASKRQPRFMRRGPGKPLSVTARPGGIRRSETSHRGPSRDTSSLDMAPTNAA